MEAYFGTWLVSTLLLMWLQRRNRNSSSSTDQQPSKYTDSNVNSIGSPIPAVLGRVMIKNPLCSYYGDFDYRAYTEEYGAHSNLNIWPAVVMFLITIIFAISQKDSVVFVGGTGQEFPSSGGGIVGGGSSLPSSPTIPSQNQLTVLPGQSVATSGGSGSTTSPGQVQGQIEFAESGKKRQMILTALFAFIQWLLLYLINKHLLKTTIQKGFKYYLGWQNILCWTGKNMGIKRLWMNVYDTNVESSTQQGVWGSDNISWKKDNPTGIVAHIDDEEMFGGVDEGGGFVGDIHLYFGTTAQGHDSWMVDQMNNSQMIPAELKGLTPVYPMYFTSVVHKSYIGKQATIPEMWFEIVNYPDGLATIFDYDLQGIYDDHILDYVQDMLDFIGTQTQTTQQYLQPYTNAVTNDYGDYKQKAQVSNIKRKTYDNARDALEEAQNEYDANSTQQNKNALDAAQQAYDNAKQDYDTAQADTDNAFGTLKNSINDLINNYPQSEKDEFDNRTQDLQKLLNNGIWHLGRLGDDLNPAEAIYEILSNDYWGCAYTDTRIDINSLLNMGITLEEEGLGISCLINKTTKAGQVISKILNHVNGVYYDDPRTGKLTFKLIRNDYDMDKIPKFSPHNCNSLVFTRLDWSETTSAVTASFTYANDKFNTSTLMVSDVANIRITKNYTEQQVDGEYFTTENNVRTFAQRQLLSSAYPLSAIDIQCNRVGYDITIGDAILVNWLPYGIEKQVFRVTDVDYATLTNGMIKITAIEDIFGFDKIKYEFSDAPSWNDPSSPPEDLINELFMEMPYEFLRSLDTYVYAFVPQTISTNTYWHLWRYVSNKYQDVAQSSEFSTVLRMTYGCDEIFGLDSGFECTVIDEYSQGKIDLKRKNIANDPNTYTNTSGLNLLCVDDEIMSYKDIELLANGNYKFVDVIRGVFDTLPSKHTAESRVYLLDFGMNVSGTYPCAYQGNISQEQLEVTSQTQSDSQKFDANRLTHLTTTRRAEQPTVMANMQFGADRGTLTEYKYNWPATTQFSYDLLFMFNGRNKFQNYGILQQTDNTTTLTVSTTVKNVITISSNSVDMEFMSDGFDSVNNTNSVSDTLKWSNFCKEMDNRLKETNDIHMQVRTYDSNTDLYSHASYTKDLYYVAPRLAGIVPRTQDVQAYADSIVQSTILYIPAGQVSPSLTMTYEDCPMIAVGNVSPANLSDTSLVRGQDGKWYHFTGDVYRVDGAIQQKDANGNLMFDASGNPVLKAEVHKITLDEEFVFRTNFTTYASNYSVGYKMRTGVLIPWTFYP